VRLQSISAVFVLSAWMTIAAAETPNQQLELGDSDTNKNLTLSTSETVPGDKNTQRYRQQIQQILSNEDFSKKETVKKWRWISTEDKVERQEKFPEWIISWLEFMEANQSLIKTTAKIIEVLLWCLLAFIIVFVILRYHQVIRNYVTNNMGSTVKTELPSSLFGIDLKEEKLPNDIVEEAKKLWDQNKIRDAIALLLKASFIRVINDYNVRLLDSHTENECCIRIDSSTPSNIAAFMRRLVAQWQMIAYGHKPPLEQDFLWLCSNWRLVFEQDTKSAEV